MLLQHDVAAVKKHAASRSRALLMKRRSSVLGQSQMKDVVSDAGAQAILKGQCVHTNYAEAGSVLCCSKPPDIEFRPIGGAQYTDTDAPDTFKVRASTC